MTEPCNHEQQQHCNQQFDVLFEKLDRIDVAIRGNGKPGITVRLDRLEQNAKRQSRMIWILFGAIATAAATAVATWLVK